MRGTAALSFAACAAAASLPSFTTDTIHDGAAPILSSVNADAIPNNYIIKFKKHVTDSHVAKHHSWLKSVQTNKQDDLRKRGQFPFVDSVFTGKKHEYNIGNSFRGYSGHFDEDDIEQIRRHPDVEAIEQDTLVHTMKFESEESCNGDLEKMAPWGLARVSHRDPLSFGTFNKYLYAHEGGEGVDAYVIDTGTNIEHVDFEGRAHWGTTIPKNEADEDGNGHGTHCSGTVAGSKYGVAKKAHVYAVKVLRSSGSGTMSDVIAGVEFAATSHEEQVSAAKKGKRKGFKGSVANMSLGGGKTNFLDEAVNAAVDAGIHFAVAAGNDNADACNYSPAAADKAVTVGATAIDDSRAYFSNYGQCTDIFAPGLSIQSTWKGSKHAVNTISGTSMASPHIAGLLAYYLSLQPSSDSDYAVAPITPKELKSQLIGIATVGALSDIPEDTPNLLAWNGGGCNNYSSIIESGNYKAQPRGPKVDGIGQALKVALQLGKAVEDDYKVVSGKVVSAGEILVNKVDKVTDKMHDVVDEGLKGILGEFEL